MQLARVVGRLAHEEHSWPLGAVRMTERFGRRSARRHASSSALRDHVADELEDCAVAGAQRRRIVGIGGTVAQPRRRDQRAGTCPSFGVQGHRHPARCAGELVDTLADAASRRSAGSCAGIKPARADIILAGAAASQTVLDAGELRGRRGHRGGPARGRLLLALARARAGRPAAVRRRPPSAVACANLGARQYHVDHAHTEHVARLALGLFDELAAAGLHPGDRDRARAAVGGGRAARHRHERRLRRPSQALALPDPQRRPAGLHAARGRAHRPGRPLPPQGHAELRPVRPADDARATTSCSPASRSSFASPRTSSAPATSSSARPTPTSTTVASSSASRPPATRRSPAGPPARETELFASRVRPRAGRPPLNGVAQTVGCARLRSTRAWRCDTANAPPIPISISAKMPPAPIPASPQSKPPLSAALTASRRNGRAPTKGL